MIEIRGNKIVIELMQILIKVKAFSSFFFETGNVGDAFYFRTSIFIILYDYQHPDQ